jgi:hypothetical protein
MKFWVGRIIRGEMRGLANMSHDAAHISHGNAGRSAYLRSFLRAFPAASGPVKRRNQGIPA